MTNKKQNQSTGNNSTNIQAQNIYNISGLDESEVREVALETFRSNIENLSKEAERIAIKRAEKITDKFLHKLVQNGFFNSERFKQPDIQIALFDAQRNFAQNGDETTEEMLVNLLADLAKTSDRNLFLTATQDALKLIPRLTQKQVDILALNFLCKEMYFMARTPNKLHNFIYYISLFVTTVGFDSPDLSHLESIGCFQRESSRKKDLVDLLINTYPGLFCGGFLLKDINNELKQLVPYKLPLTTCTHDESKLQFDGATMAEVIDASPNAANNTSSEDRLNLYQFMQRNTLNREQAKAYLLKINPAIEPVIQGGFNYIFEEKITPLGAVIARANFLRKTGCDISLPYRMRDMYSLQ